MHILITGSSGLIGSALVPHLRAAGHDVVRLVRREVQAEDEAWWDPLRGEVDPAAMARADGVVHLAGEGVGDRRWSEDHKRRIIESRELGTATMARAVAEAKRPPALVTASGINYYGYDRGDEELTEASSTGDGFLAEVCRRAEATTQPAVDAGARVVKLRTGIVLARKGGALARLLPLVRLGLGGPLGGGRAWWSWIALDDHIRVIERVLTDDGLHGAVNSTAPQPARNGDLMRAVAHALHRPAAVPAPKFGPALLFGKEMAKEMANINLRVLPRVLLDRNHLFRHPQIDAAAQALFS